MPSLPLINASSLSSSDKSPAQSSRIDFTCSFRLESVRGNAGIQGSHSMFEIRKTSEFEPYDYGLFIDDVLLKDVDITGFHSGDDDELITTNVATTTQSATNTLLEYSLRELSEGLGFGFRLFYEVSWNEAVGQLWPMMNMQEEQATLLLVMDKVSRWRRSYSFDEYFEALNQASKNSLSTTLVVEGPRPEEAKGLMPFDVFIVSLLDINREASLKEQLEQRLNDFRNLHETVVSQLEVKYPTDTLEVSFDFPEEVRVPCEQYLLYFVEFLRDLGVDATAELRHVAGEALFAITPTDKATALDNIRTALETYLMLPSSPLDTDSIVEYEIAAQRLAANVDHLKGQLRLKHAELVLANATIQTQQVTIDYLLSGDIILQSVKDVTPRTIHEDKEMVLGRAVALTKIDKYGVEVNLAEIFRKLRRLFSKTKNKELR